MTDEFSKMKEEVPPPLIDTHLKSVEEAIKDGVSVDANFGLDKTGIAGTAAEEDKEQDKGLPQAILKSVKICVSWMQDCGLDMLIDILWMIVIIFVIFFIAKCKCNKMGFKNFNL